MELKGMVALVTGASRGIGRSISMALAREGVRVCLVATNADLLEALRSEIERSGGKALAFAADVRDRDRMKQAAKETVARFGGLDILVNNAGVMPTSYLKSLKEDEWDRMIDVNCKGVLNGLSACLPTMLDRERGHVVFISSDAGRKVFPGLTVYSATKYFVEALARGLRQEVKDKNIRVTSIQPGDVDTDIGMESTDSEALEDLYGSSEYQMLSCEHIASSVVYALKQPSVCCVNEILVEPLSMPI